MNGLQFTDETARQLKKVYLTRDVIAQRSETIRHLSLSAGERVLDIGCGPGEWVLSVAERFPASRVIGIDISVLMIDYAISCAKLQRRSNAHFQVMDARYPLTFSDASFDAITARFIAGFQSTATWPLLVGQCSRLLRPGGIFCSTEFEDL